MLVCLFGIKCCNLIFLSGPGAAYGLEFAVGV